MKLTFSVMEALGLSGLTFGLLNMRKTNQLSVRLPDVLRIQLEKACEVTGLDAATVARACLQAFVEQIEANGEITLPLAVLPKSKAGGKTPEPSKNAELARSTPRAIYAEDLAAPSPSTIAAPRLNEDAASPPQSPGPRPRSTRPGVEKTVGREKGKSAS